MRHSRKIGQERKIRRHSKIEETTVSETIRYRSDAELTDTVIVGMAWNDLRAEAKNGE